LHLVNFISIKNLLLAKGRLRENTEEEGEIASFSVIRRTAFHEVTTLCETKISTPIVVKHRFVNNRYSFLYNYVAEE